jgi:hypothetical protein
MNCPLITLGLVIDHLGFVKHTHVFEGNVSEPKTLYDILEFISDNLNKPTSNRCRDCNKRQHRAYKAKRL